MRVIPVLDLRGGLAVRARRGDRAAYAPLVSALSPDPDPVRAASALLGFAPFDRLYIADLDAIEGRLCNMSEISFIKNSHPQVEIWLDAGFSRASQVEAALALGVGRVVLGSESLTCDRLPREMVRRGAPIALSLDQRGESRLGPPALHEDARLWPEHVILMPLARVGAGGGPDLNLLRAARALSPKAKLYAAGGVRGPEDLAALKAAGAEGVLISSALHAGAITAADVAPFSAPEKGQDGGALTLRQEEPFRPKIKSANRCNRPLGIGGG